jgi:pimeloyl-ACP methyl ester carboxylesterase
MTDTIVLIHGAWMTPRSWEPFREFYEASGYHVLTPAWPHLDAEVEDLRRDPSAMAGLGVQEIVDHYETLIKQLDTPPIIMGHSFGGLYVQMLLDRGLGAAGVAIDAAAPKGVLRLPLAQIRSISPVLRNPWNYGRPVALNFKQFKYAFANTMSEQAARDQFELNAVPTPGRIFFEAGLANLNPRASTKVNYRNEARAPLLLISGGDDHTIPAAVNRSNLAKYRRSGAITNYAEFPGRSHLTLAQDGWEEVATHALTWAQEQAGLRAEETSLKAAG